MMLRSFPQVNEYGVIHQTITLREADEWKLTYSGGPETRDRYVIVLLYFSMDYSVSYTHCAAGSPVIHGQLHIVDGVIPIWAGNLI